MKKLRHLILIACITLTTSAWGQALSTEVQAAFDACVALRAAVGAGSGEGLKQANKALKACEVKPFKKLRCTDGEEPSYKGHFLFETEFVDSLIQNRKVYKFAQQYAERAGQRATSSSGKVFAKTCMVKGKKSVTYSLVSRGKQDIAVVAEPKGLVTLRIHDKTHDKWYNDTDDVATGRPSRSRILDLPADKNSLLEIEVINTSKKDISFVLIGN